MVRMIAKTLIDNRMQKSFKCSFNEDFSIDHFEAYIKAICEHIDSPAPIVLAKHIRDYIMFGTTIFRTEDFVEKIFFEKLVIEAYKTS